MTKKQKEINVRVKDSNIFYSNDTSITLNPNEVTIDFKCVSQIQDLSNHNVLLIKHNAVIMTPQSAKSLSVMLNQVVKNYEKNFGKIEKSKAQKKADKLIKKKKDNIIKETQSTQSYMG